MAMLKPPMKKLLEEIPNRYMIVNVAAHRARVISQKSEDEGSFLSEKPVSTALKEIADGTLHIEVTQPIVEDSLDAEAPAKSADESTEL